MPNSIQFNEHLFLLVGAAVALACLVFGIILTYRSRALLRRHWLAKRAIQASVCAEQQAEQIARLAWQASEEEEWKL